MPLESSNLSFLPLIPRKFRRFGLRLMSRFVFLTVGNACRARYLTGEYQKCSGVY